MKLNRTVLEQGHEKLPETTEIPDGSLTKLQVPFPLVQVETFDETEDPSGTGDVFG